MKKEIPTLIAKQLTVEDIPCVLEPLTPNTMRFWNMSMAWSMEFTPKTDPKWVKVYQQLEQYNAYLKNLVEQPGFERFFAENGFCVSKEQLAEKFGTIFAEQAFALAAYPFYTDVEIRSGHLLSSNMEPQFCVTLPGCEEITFSVGLFRYDSGAPSSRNTVLLNWTEDYRDLTYALYLDFTSTLRVGGSLNLLPEENEDAAKSYANYDCYSQHRENALEPDKNLLRCVEILEDMGYLTLYKLKPAKDSPWFSYREGTYGMIAALDKKYCTDPLLMKKLRLVLAQPETEVESCRYFLTDANGKQYLSDTPGTLGGHRELKIYGKLDCSSANRHIANGQYVRHRVFFADEAAAVAAGYRPCGVCMKEAYKLWLENNES